MLLEFSCSNYKSIKEKVVFSFIAGKDDTFQNELREFSNFKVLRSAIIYGANGSGKTNFLNALNFMRMMVVNSINHQPGSLILCIPHKLSSKEDGSSFSIQFVKNDVRYAYGFSVQNGLISEEYLYSFPQGRQTKIFERDNMNISEGS